MGEMAKEGIRDKQEEWDKEEESIVACLFLNKQAENLSWDGCCGERQTNTWSLVKTVWVRQLRWL